MESVPVLTEFHIGIDDTDSRFGGCTTYTATILFQELVSKGFKPADFPWLVRLNPNVPWKTRGNGALSLHFNLEEGELDEAEKISLAVVEQTSDVTKQSTDPAVVFLKGPVPTQLTEFSTRALHDILSVREARNVADAASAETHLLKGSRGLVGALASVGADFGHDRTFEIIAYRTHENRGSTRRVNQDSVRQMDAAYRGLTFNNIDLETGRVLICPHGPDPVLFGIRGEDPASLANACALVGVEEQVERIMIFKTNQGTDAHLRCRRRIEALQPYQSTMIVGVVSNAPQIIRGGHAIFKISDETGSIDCAAYSATGSIRETAVHLIPGDSVVVSGGIRGRRMRELTLNIEKLEVTGLANAIRWENPLCSDCGARCESMGKDQGFRCRKCNLHFQKASKSPKSEPRAIGCGIYLPPPRAHRHLTKPASRHEFDTPKLSDASGALFGPTLPPRVRVAIVS
jgi:tRNA(Ile2)-agmatinylcytidine synthase